VGIVLSIVSVRALLSLLPAGKIPRTGEVKLDGWVLAFALGLSLVTGIIFGLAPALRATRRQLREAVSEGGRGITGHHERLRGALVTAEIALALVLLTGAGLLVRSFLQMRSVNPGFRSSNLLAATVDLPDSRYRNAVQMRALDERVLAALSVLPGAESVATVNWIPFKQELVRGDFQLEDGRHLPRGFLVDKPVVSPDYFRTMGIQLLSGRGFTDRDNSTAPGVAVVSESVARRLWPRGDAIGKRISMEDKPKPGDWLTIVGIVRDVRQQSPMDTPSASVYQPYSQVNRPFFLGHMSFVVQTGKNPMAMASGIRAVIYKMDQKLPTQSVTTMEAIIADTISEPRSEARLLGLFSFMALLLAAIGIYGVLSCSVAERTHEIGIRTAMGAGEKDVLWMVLRQTLVLAGSGVLIGTLGALSITRVLTKFLFEVTPTDPLTFLAVAAILLIVALLSAWIPAQRAARVHPLVALRYQ
jgi:putative ABC transport system permease protein